MTAQATLTNHQVRLAARPVGLPTRANWSFTSEPVPELADGDVLVKTLYLSLDPAMRGWMNEGKSYIAPVGIGEVMRAGGVGRRRRVEEPGASRSATTSTPGLGVQEYCLIRAADAQAQRRSSRSTCDSARRRSGSTCSACRA